MSSNIAERKERILRILAEDRSISVSALSKQLGVTVVTTRSDLATLEAEGYLVRTHGGAIPTRHPKIMERIQKNRDAKNVIAAHAANFIEDGDTISMRGHCENGEIRIGFGEVSTKILPAIED